MIVGDLFYKSRRNENEKKKQTFFFKLKKKRKRTSQLTACPGIVSTNPACALGYLRGRVGVLAPSAGGDLHCLSGPELARVCDTTV